MIEAYQNLIEGQMISWAAAYLSSPSRELWPQTEIRFCSRLLSPVDERGRSSTVKLSTGILQSFIQYLLVKGILSKISGSDIAMMVISTPAVNVCSGAILPGALIRYYCKHQVSIYFDYYRRIT
jgi:hypothetical protein